MIFWKSGPRAKPIFTGCDFMIGLGKPQQQQLDVASFIHCVKPKLCIKFQVISSSHWEILKRDFEILGAPVVQIHAHFFY